MDDYKSGDEVVHDQPSQPTQAGQPTPTPAAANGFAWGSVSKAVLQVHVQGWFLKYKGWTDLKADTRRDLLADANAMVELGIDGDDLHVFLDELATRTDPDDVNRLSYFWQPLQELQSARLKTSTRPHTRRDELSKVGPVLPSIRSSEGSH